jgi:hypothetical protein
MTTEHKTIWLQPTCPACELYPPDIEGRQWCQENMWSEGCDCGAMPVKYVLAPDQPTRDDVEEKSEGT